MSLETYKVKTGRNLYKKESKYINDPIKGKKALRTDEIDHSLVTVNGIRFDADEKAMDRMGRVVAAASWEFNKALSQGTTADMAYTQVYEDTTLTWKSADNQFVEVSIATLCEVHRNALNNLSIVWAKYG